MVFVMENPVKMDDLGVPPMDKWFKMDDLGVPQNWIGNTQMPFMACHGMSSLDALPFPVFFF